MKEFLCERGIPYVLRNVAADPAAREEFLRLGAPLPPIVAYRDRWVAGYDPKRLEELLAEVE